MSKRPACRVCARRFYTTRSWVSVPVAVPHRPVPRSHPRPCILTGQNGSVGDSIIAQQAQTCSNSCGKKSHDELRSDWGAQIPTQGCVQTSQSEGKGIWWTFLGGCYITWIWILCGFWQYSAKQHIKVMTLCLYVTRQGRSGWWRETIPLLQPWG